MKSDGQQFHQYQQNNHLSPQIIDQKKKDHDIVCWKASPGLGQA